MEFQSIPIFRIFDEQKAKAFYVDFLGMQVDWEHRFEADMPVYMQVSKEGLVFHLSEHSGDCTPGSKVFIYVDDLDGLYADLQSRPYAYSRPSIEFTSWGERGFSVTDPFSNKIWFNESAEPV